MRRGHVCLARISVCLVVFFGFVIGQRTIRSESVLASHWQLDEGTGTTTNDAVAGGTGTLQDDATWTTGKSGAAVNMDGAGDYISLPRIDVTGSAITLSAWVKNSSFATEVEQRFVSKAYDSSEERTSWMLGQTNAGGQNRLQFRLRADRVTTTLIASTGTLPLNTWYHAAATYDGTTMRLYLNGTEVGSVAKSGSISRGRYSTVDLGRSPDGSNYLSGAIDDVRIYSSALTAAEVAALAGTAPSTPTSGNQPPSVSLTAPASGATFNAPASITLTATASDTDGTIARVDFYAGSTLLGSDPTAPYSFSWSNVVAGSYSLTAVARDSDGASTVSSTRDITVKPPTLPSTAVFTPSSNDATAVDRYVLEVFPFGADTAVANPVATQDLGKPAITNGSCSADVSSTILALIPGSYIATVTAIGPGGSTQSAPSPQFTR
jgi:concanavalin A-like lectin/glucanase superfamily protein/Big-like domain-containing protein